MNDEAKTRAALLDEVVRLRRKLAVLETSHARRGLSLEEKDLASELTVAHEKLAMFRRFAEAASQGFSMADVDGRITYLNPALCRMLGEPSPEAGVGKHLSAYFSEEMSRKGQEEIEPALAGSGYWEGELIMLSVDGRAIPTWHNTFVIQDESGNPLRLAVVITDITERRQAQAALERERRTLDRMLQASDHERQLIAYEIHDGLAQQLAGAIMQFEIFDHLKESRPGEADKAYREAMAMLRQGHFEARRLISGVRPPILDESGVVAALTHLVNEECIKQNTKVEFQSKIEFCRLAPVLENAVYRIVQEGLNNAVRHSGSETVRISLTQRDDTIRIEVCDWGIGFDPEGVEMNRFGLEGIRERARLLDGRCDIRSRSEGGTSIVVELPLGEKWPQEDH